MVSSAVPKPANWRIVHSRPRYIDGYTPRVYGNSPGSPIASSRSAGRSRSVYSGLIGSPEIVENGASRSGAREPLPLPALRRSTGRGHRTNGHHGESNTGQIAYGAVTAGKLGPTSVVMNTGTVAANSQSTVVSTATPARS